MSRQIWTGNAIPYGKMPTSKSLADHSTADTKEKPVGPDIQRSNTLCSDTTDYLAQDFIGEGRFGKVYKCVNLVTAKEVAVKIYISKRSMSARREFKMLQLVSALDPERKNLIRLFEKFEYKGHTCLSFEMLDKSLFQLVSERCLNPLSLSEIRPIAQQLLTALEALKSIGVIHSDLKADNIMLVNHQKMPFRVKLIDFGSSFTTSEVTCERKPAQPLGYRAPEITLGLPITEAIDIWGLGCVLAFSHLRKYLFSVHSEYLMMVDIVKILGQPADHLLKAGSKTMEFFKPNQHWNKPQWWLKTQGEFQLESNIIMVAEKKKNLESLNDLITAGEPAELEDQRAFVSFLQCLLQVDSKERITPERALQHPFVTMAHLRDKKESSPYAAEAFDKMLVCQMVDSPDAAALHTCHDLPNVPLVNNQAPEMMSTTNRTPDWLRRLQTFFGRAPMSNFTE